MSPTTTSTDSHDSLKHSLCVLHRPTHIHTCGGSALRGGNQEGQRRQRRGEWLQSAGSAVIRRHSFAANHVSCLPCPFIKKPHARCPCCMIFYPHPTSRSTTNATASTSTPPQTLSSFMPSAAEQKDCAICVSWRGGGTNTQRDWNREEVVLLYLKMAHWPQRPILITRLHISVAFNRLCLVYYRSTDDSTHHTFCFPSNPGCATVSQPQSRVKQIGCVTVNQLLCNAIAALGTLTLVTIQTQSNPRQAEGDQSPASKQNKIEQKEKSEHNFTTSGCVRVCRQPTDCSSSPPIKDLGAVSQP